MPKKNNGLRQTMTAEMAGQPGVNVGASNSDGFSERMKVLAKAVGSVAEIARKCGMAESTVKKWVDGISDPSRERCIGLARGTGASLLWIVAGEGPMWPIEQPDPAAIPPESQPLSQDALRMAVQLAAEALEDRRKILPPDKYAELVSIIYELLLDGLPEAKILRLARATAAEGD